MEHALSHVVKEFEVERDLIGKLAREELDEVRKVVRRLRSNMARKSMEMKHIKILAQHILNQRSELEKFFMEALDYVKESIKADAQKRAKEQDMHNHARRNVYFDCNVDQFCHEAPNPTCRSCSRRKAKQ